ncbi:MAG: single-stranded-DNA-specific exonuclease RecJ [Hyphomicrobiales bacterium]|nr:single-stranded-DNA-specific exonuclease RecJ [Hyphomicrobiales bacterium]
MLTLPLEAPRAAPKPYLGVTSSARSLVWFDRLSFDKAPLAAAISQRHGVHELVGRILASRGARLEDVVDWLNPTLKRLLPDPLSLLDMEAGAERLASAIMKREAIAIFGDYDVDGATSAALLSLFISAHGTEPRIYIPDRMTEGYGPNEAAIGALIDEGARLIVTVDCGATSNGPLSVAAKRGVDVIVADHHQANETLPPALAIINPNRLDDLSGQGHLSAAGVVFLLLVATMRRLRVKGAYGNGRAEPDLLAWLDLVALSTVCDVVPIQGVNRAFIAQGLRVMRHRRNAGVRALADAAGLKSPPSPYHLGFVLGPRINAGGRIGDSSLGARLLSTVDSGEAERIAAILDRLNRERQDMEAAMLKAAIADAEGQLAANSDMPIIIAASPDYHKGIAGLLASRLTEQFQRPSLVIAWDEAAGQGTGSARSVAGVDIGRAVRAAAETGVAVKGGGHAMAAGLTVEREKFGALQDLLNAELAGSTTAARAIASLEVDGALSAQGATHELMEQIDKAGPYGAGAPNPRFVLPMHRISAVKPAGPSHFRCKITSSGGAILDAVAFRANGAPLGEALMAAKSQPMHVAGRLNRDTWGGHDRIELMIEDVADPAKQRG